MFDKAIYLSHFIYVIPLVEIFDKLLNSLVCLNFYSGGLAWQKGCREAIFVHQSTIDSPIFSYFLDSFLFFPIFSILKLLFSYFFLSNYFTGHLVIIIEVYSFFTTISNSILSFHWSYKNIRVYAYCNVVILLINTQSNKTA